MNQVTGPFSIVPHHGVPVWQWVLVAVLLAFIATALGLAAAITVQQYREARRKT